MGSCRLGEYFCCPPRGNCRACRKNGAKAQKTKSYFLRQHPRKLAIYSKYVRPRAVLNPCVGLHERTVCMRLGRRLLASGDKRLRPGNADPSHPRTRRKGIRYHQSQPYTQLKSYNPIYHHSTVSTYCTCCFALGCELGKHLAPHWVDLSCGAAAHLCGSCKARNATVALGIAKETARQQYYSTHASCTTCCS